jgi:glucose-1-phosphate cytidylyltransferase
MNKADLRNVPVVILAGGLGTRLREQTEFMPKPMVPIGTRPILWHIMKIYSHYGFNRFIVCLGYKGDAIKDYFLNYRFRNSDLTVHLGNHDDIVVNNVHVTDDWQVTLAETGLNTMTGARIKKIRRYIDTHYFLLTYGDGVSDVNIGRLVDFHLSHGKIATITGVRPPARFGELRISENQVIGFSEKPQVEGDLINGGFFVFNQEVFEYLRQDSDCSLEREPLERLAADNQLMVYAHSGFWQCMDTYRDMDVLNKYWESEHAPWKVWA